MWFWEMCDSEAGLFWAGGEAGGGASRRKSDMSSGKGRGGGSPVPVSKGRESQTNRSPRSLEWLCGGDCLAEGTPVKRLGGERRGCRGASGVRKEVMRRLSHRGRSVGP